jgi:tRNA threonylcarbamoyladenosine biosynthesis protein TsaB
MILALHTTSPTTQLWFAADPQSRPELVEWESGRDLADQLLGRIESELAQRQSKLEDLTGLMIFSGPGSFTSLRIGHTVANALAASLNIPIVSTRGDAWLTEGLARLTAGDNDRMTTPFYGAEANVTRPKA